MTWKSTWGVVLAVVLALALAPSSSARHLACGDAIATDTTLDGDLVDCPANGLAIVASGVTLDLAGHTIDGLGTANIGVVTMPGVSNVTVVNGAVTEFHDAISLRGGTGHLVRTMTLSHGHEGIRLTQVTDSTVESVSASDNDGSAVNATFCTRLTITANHLFGNSAAMTGAFSDNITVSSNAIEDNVFYGLRFADVIDSLVAHNRLQRNGDHGMRLGVESTGNRLVRNFVSETGGGGFVLDDDSGANVLEQNRSDRNGGDGFEIDGPGAKLIRNSASRNGDLGFEAPLGAALADRNKARHNANTLQCVGVPCR